MLLSRKEDNGEKLSSTAITTRFDGFPSCKELRSLMVLMHVSGARLLVTASFSVAISSSLLRDVGLDMTVRFMKGLYLVIGSAMIIMNCSGVVSPVVGTLGA